MSAAASQPLDQPPPAYGSELERRAAEVRRERAAQLKIAAQREVEAAALRLTLAQPCPEHDAPPGKPCWSLPVDDPHQRAGKAVCGRRAAQAVGVARLRREREAREQARATRSRPLAPTKETP